MTDTEYMIYGAVAFVIAATFFIGRSMDRQQSTSNVTWKTGNITRKTIIQSVVIGAVGGPIVFFFRGGELLHCVACMAAAPFVVDLLRPTVTIK